MARFLIIAIVVVAIWYVAWQALRYVKSKDIDWTGVTFAAGFVALAFYLHYATGIGM